LNLGEADRLLLEQFKADMMADPDLGAQARANDLEHFRLVFEKRFLNDIASRMDDNESIFRRILDDEEFRVLLFDVYLRDVYQTLRGPDDDRRWRHHHRIVKVCGRSTIAWRALSIGTVPGSRGRGVASSCSNPWRTGGTSCPT
jgi:hypothetical protein